MNREPMTSSDQIEQNTPHFFIATQLQLQDNIHLLLLPQTQVNLFFGDESCAPNRPEYAIASKY